MKANAVTASTLNFLFADEFENQIATRNFLADTTGTGFSEFHELLKTQASGIDQRLNLLAWEIGLTGEYAPVEPAGPSQPAIPATARPGLHKSLDEMLASLIDLREFLKTRLEAVAGRSVHRCSELMADLVAGHERDARMLRRLQWGRRAAASRE
jgi:DNA-binding ferritin-like protein